MWSREIENQLAQAIEQNDLPRVKATVATGDIDFFAVNAEEETFLHLAAKLDSPGVLQFFLTAIEESLADFSDDQIAKIFPRLINALDKEKNTALLCASRQGKRENVLLLLKYGATTYLGSEKGLSFFKLIANPKLGVTFSQLDDVPQLDSSIKRGDEIRQRVLTEHRYGLILYPRVRSYEYLEFAELKKTHLQWAAQLSLQRLMREKLWLSKELFALTADERRLVYADSSSKLETDFYMQRFIKNLERSLKENNQLLTFSPRSQLALSMPWLKIFLTTKYPSTGVFIVALLVCLAIPLILIGVFSGVGALGGLFIANLIAGVAALITLGSLAYKFGPAVYHDIFFGAAHLQLQHKLLNETITHVLPLAKAILENLVLSKDANLQATIAQLNECIHSLEQGSGVINFFFYIDVIGKLAELKSIRKNTQYFLRKNRNPLQRRH